MNKQYLKKQLEETKYVFVYGTLMKGFRLNKILSATDTEYIGESESIDNNFTMFIQNSTRIPFLNKRGKCPSIKTSTVKGEVYKITSNAALGFLDSVENVPYLYVRKKDKFKVTGRLVQAWYYLGTRTGSIEESYSGWSYVPKADYKSYEQNINKRSKQNV